VSIKVRVRSTVKWVNVYIGHRYLASGPPYSYDWNSATVANGSHILSIRAYNDLNRRIATAGVNVHVRNGSSTPTPTPSPSPTATPTPTSLSFSHVFLVVEENHSYAEVVGNSGMPYLNSLIQTNGLATQYYANTHPSLPDYLWLSSGSNDGITDDDCASATGALKVDNVVRELNDAGLSWKAYAESLPAVGYMGCSSGEYVQRHNPFMYYSDVIDNSTEQQKIVPFTQFAIDRENNALPRFSYIVPNLLDDAHDGTLAQADNWLQGNIGPLLSTAMFQAGGAGLLIVVFDEGTDSTNGGGQVAWVAISPKAKVNYKSVAFYQHQSTLRLMLQGLGVTTFPGAAAAAPNMSEFFQ
jgi:acid phosphatase